MSRSLARFLSVILIVVLGWSVSLQQTCSQESEANKPAATADVPALIKQLDADDFAARQEASQRLIAAGDAALPAVEKAVQSDSREVATRAFEILKTHVDNGTPGLKEAAKQSLDRIAKADLGSISKRASDILAPPQPATPNGRPPIAIAPGGIRIAGARIAIAAGAVGGGTETKIKIEDGVKTTEVKDKDRKVKIVDDPAKGIQLEITETKDGKETTQKYEAKNADELKTKHAEAHKIYEQYNAKGAEIKIGGGAFAPGIPILPRRLVPAIPGAPVPPLPPAIPVLPIEVAPAPAPAPKKSLDSLEALEKSLQDAEANLKELSKDVKDNEQLARARTRLEEARKQLEQLRSALK
jgi:hypothetical protein